MGTSTSSSGGKAGSPFDPEWLKPDNSAGESTGGGDVLAPEENTEPQIAPKRRHAEARSKMSGYLSGKGSASMRSAISRMINKSMGGTKRAAASMSHTAKSTGALAQFLTSAREGSDPIITDWVNETRKKNLSANDLILEVVKEVVPNTGSIDDESLRNATCNALSQLYEQEPDVDILALTDQQIYQVMAITIANEICNRVDLLLGQMYEKLKYNPQQIQKYSNDIQEYVQATVNVLIDSLSGSQLSLQKLSQKALQSALEVFAHDEN